MVDGIAGRKTRRALIQGDDPKALRKIDLVGAAERVRGGDLDVHVTETPESDEIGTLITKPFRCEGGRLTINAAARGGMVSAAVLDEEGIQYEGYSRVDCALFDGDSVRHDLTWRHKGSLEELKSRTIRLKFYLRDSKLYSYSIHG